MGGREETGEDPGRARGGGRGCTRRRTREEETARRGGGVWRVAGIHGNVRESGAESARRAFSKQKEECGARQEEGENGSQWVEGGGSEAEEMAVRADSASAHQRAWASMCIHRGGRSMYGCQSMEA